VERLIDFGEEYCFQGGEIFYFYKISKNFGL
jgi:hypothetical protein